MIRRLTYCFVLVLFTSSGVHAQGEVKELDSVSISGNQLLRRETTVSITTIRIERRLADDAGKIISLFPGVQVKSYGGLGGMKTVSFHSLGAGHTSVVYDQFALSQTQSGQTDVGQIPVDFIDKIELVSQAGTSLSYPIHSKLSGQIIAIQTRHLPKDSDSPVMNLGIQTGSFGQIGGHVFLSRNVQKWKFSASLKGRTFEGDYPFTYQNGNTEIRTTRTNGYLNDFYGTVAASCKIDSSQYIHGSYTGSYFDKGLPGAVVFYNETAGQKLFGNNHLGTFRHLYSGKRIEGSTTASFQYNQLHYVDSNYLNAAGYLHSRFFSQESALQSQWNYHSANDSLHVLAGGGLRHEQLNSSSFSSTPTRWSIDGIIAFNWHFIGQLAGQIGLQSIQDIRPDETRQQLVVLPSLEWKGLFGPGLGWGVGYRYTVRQPSFNELYYNQIGNTGLRPEKAHLFSGQLYYQLQSGGNTGNWLFDGGIQPFYALATDKILAVPTKNLFIWSIQNIGRSQAIGTEVRQHILTRIGKTSCSLRLQYTFQYTQDISDPTGPTYGHLLSYSPLHTGTSELDFNRKHLGLSFLLSYQGERYALNQNIPSNLLEDFLLLDASVSYRFILGKQQLVTRLAINNITNNYYSYIRYFVMPGINWALRMSWEIHR